MGVELEPTFAYLKAEEEYFDVSAQYIGLHVNFLYQKWLSNRIMSINVRLGLGAYMVKDYQYTFSGGSGDTLSSLYLSAGGGVSFFWFIFKPWFLEFGANYSHVLTINDDLQQGHLSPTVGIGFQF